MKSENYDSGVKGKIVVLSSHTPSLFWFRLDMMKEFIKHGYEVYAVGNESEEIWRNQFEEHGIYYKEIFVERNGINPINDIKTFFSIKQILTNIRPDKIFVFQAKTIIYGCFAANALGITEVYPLIAGIGSVFLKDDLKTRLVRKIMSEEYALSLRMCKNLFFQNKDDKEIFSKNNIIKRSQDVVYLNGSGVNIDKFKLLSLPQKTAFLCISRLIKDKGVREYLEACKIIKDKYPDVRCMIVGPYDTNPSAIKHEEMNEYIKSGIEYFGEQKDVRPYLEQASVFVLPSYREGTPKVNLEAMATGRAVITTDAPGCRETVINGKNGFLVPVKNIKELVDKMEYFILNPKVVFKMGSLGRQIVEDKFDVKKVNQVICNTMGLTK